MTEENIFTRIAREHLHVETLETQGRDSLDFHDLGVGSIKAALEAAYQAGQEAALKDCE